MRWVFSVSGCEHALGVRSFFSMGESMLSIEAAVDRAVELGYKSIAIADTMTMSGMIKLFGAAKGKDIKPVIGCRLRIVDDATDKTKKKDRKEPNLEFYPKVYALNGEGVKDIYKILSMANDDDHYYYFPRIGRQEFYDMLGRGNLAVSTGDFYSVFAHKEYVSILNSMISAAGVSRLFVELVPLNTPLFDTLNNKAIEMAEAAELQTVLTRPALYSSDEDADSRDVLSTIVQNQKMIDPWRQIPFLRTLSLCPPATVIQECVSASKRRALYYTGDATKMWRAAVDGMSVLVNMCEYTWEKQGVSLPTLVADEHAELVRLVKEGWRSRLMKPTLGYQPSAAQLVEYKERLAYEIKILNDMGFENYFLVVHDLVSWAKREGIIVGPGRGSAGGSLVSYLLGITDVDPIRFNLIFERFINPDRLDLPDVDLDFMSSRRHEVIGYLVGRYGQECVAGISNYGTLGSSSALRDASRVFGLDPLSYSCSKLVPAVHGSSSTLEEAVEEVPEIERFRDANPEVWRHATRLQGAMRSLGRHAAGIVVAGEPVINRAVVERRKGEYTVNWDKRVVEEQGLIKMDILGLSTLDVLELARRKIKQTHKVDVDYTQLPLDDPKVMDAFGKGETIGVFQFESPGMRNLLRDLAADGALSFDDVAAATALYRPGPMDSGLMEDYVTIKQGLNYATYDHPNMKAALKPTHGVIIYQEQVMQLARDLAGFSMAGADHLRKAMGKKDKQKMMEQRDKWVDGCEAHSNMDRNQAGVLFDKVEAFAGYGFNRSHAVEYSIISYWTLWVKVYYPAEFYAASMSVVGEDKLKGLVKDAQDRNIFVIPPDINRSTGQFEIGFDSKREQVVLITPFNRIKGCSDNTTNAILAARDKARVLFDSKDHFLENVNKTKCNKRIQESLSRVGAFAYLPGADVPARHPDRLRDQMELMPGLVVDVIKADRKIVTDKFIKTKIIHMMNEVRQCEGCSLKGGVHPVPRLGSKPKFMVVTDSPNFSEEQDDKMLSGVASKYLVTAMKENGLTARDGYFTSLVKSPKTDKMLKNDQINGCSDYLRREIEILNPPVIIACGGAAIRNLVPGVKGGFAELCGQVHYLPNYDASVVFGINPQMIYMDSGKQEMLNEVFKTVADMVN